MDELLEEAPVIMEEAQGDTTKARNKFIEKLIDLHKDSWKKELKVLGWAFFITLVTSYIVVMGSFASLRRFGSGGMGRSR